MKRLKRRKNLEKSTEFQACNLMFKNRILSHEKITSVSSKALLNIAEMAGEASR